MMARIEYRFPVYVFDKYDEYSSILKDASKLTDIVKRIIDEYYEQGYDLFIAECDVGDYHHFRYYIILCYDCYREEKQNSKACVENPVASCTVIEAFSEDEENIDQIRIIDKYEEPPGRGWLDLMDIASRAAARVFNRIYVLTLKRVCW